MKSKNECAAIVNCFFCQFGLGNRAVFLEESTIDLKHKTMTLASQNVTFDSLLKMEETCTYTIDKENENWYVKYKKIIYYITVNRT